MTEEFPFEIKVRDKTVHYRKWKVRDRNASQDAKTSAEQRKILVYNCIKEKNFTFDNDEYSFLLHTIRDASISKKIQYNLTCEECGQRFSFETKINDVSTPVYKAWKPVKIGDHTIEFGDIANQEFYDKTIIEALENEKQSQYIFSDMILHIHSIDGNDALTMDKVIDFVNDLDLDNFDDLLIAYTDQKFHLDNIAEVICPHCQHKFKLLFDTFPDIIPWIG